MAVLPTSAVPAVTTLVLLLRPPKSRLLPLQFTFEWPLYVTFALSVVAVALAVRLGGRLDDIKVRRGSSLGEDLH